MDRLSDRPEACGARGNELVVAGVERRPAVVQVSAA